ncbi:MAG: rod shape-determining protein MreC [candidate division WOR-3 bacterium]|nr:rod shape-determining protein MreC [Candidatus Omnitrophota bacterium]MCM8806749.1 rod shape-determining protein MreC [Candidatus Omnitrophota bacterium]
MLYLFRRELMLFIFLLFSFFIEKSSLNNKKSLSFSETKKENFINYEEIIRENKRLREILNLKERKIFSYFKVAEVIGLRPYIYPAEIIIDKGRKDGIIENIPVFTKELFLIGKVEKVEETYSKIISLFHSNTKISVILGNTREVGVIEGGYGPYLLLKYIPYDSKVKINEEVYTSNFSEFYFPGIKIGRVVKICKEKNSLYLKIWVKPYIAFQGVEEVIIGK